MVGGGWRGILCEGCDYRCGAGQKISHYTGRTWAEFREKEAEADIWFVESKMGTVLGCDLLHFRAFHAFHVIFGISCTFCMSPVCQFVSFLTVLSNLVPFFLLLSISPRQLHANPPMTARQSVAADLLLPEKPLRTLNYHSSAFLLSAILGPLSQFHTFSPSANHLSHQKSGNGHRETGDQDKPKQPKSPDSNIKKPNYLSVSTTAL